MNGQDLFKVHRSADRLNENFFRMFGKKINLENFDLDKLQDARNRLRTQISQIRNQSNFNETVENDAYLQATMMLDAINAEIAERDEHIVEAEVEEGKMKDLHQDVEEYLVRMSDILTDQERYDLSHEFHELAYKLDDIGIGGVMKEINRRADETGSKWWKGVSKEFSKKFGKFAEGFEADVEGNGGKALKKAEEYLAYMSDVFNDSEEYDLANELHELSFELDKIGIGGVMKELKQLAKWGDPVVDNVYKEFSKKFGKFAEGVDGDVEEGQTDVDYELHQIARSDDEEELIDAMEGLKGAELQIALEDMMSELKDELASKGMNDVMRDEDKMIEMLMDKVIDEYGEDGEEYDYGPMDGGDADALKSAGFGSDEDYESVQNEKAPDAVRNIAGATAAALGGLGGALLGNMFAPILGGVAGAIGGAVGGAKVGSETADAVWDQVSSMLGGEKKATEAGIAHARAAKAGESSFEFDGKEYEVTLKPQEVGKAVADLKAVKEAYNESVQRGEEMTKLREGDYYYDHDDERSGSTRVMMKSNTPVYDKLVKAVTKENPDVKTATDLINYYGDEIKDVIEKLHAEGRNNNAVKPKKAAMMLDRALKQQTSESIVREGEVQQASAIVTAKTMVDRVGRWIEELSGMENETLLQLGDSIRDEMGQEQSRAFIESVAPAIQQALEILKSTRETLSTGVNTLATGEAPADMLGAESAPEAGAEGDMEMPAEEPAGDEFAAAEPAAGGAEAAGREQRESIQFQNRLMKMLAG